MKRTLLIGAGFSCDAGMPIVKEFTKFFFKRLNHNVVKEFLQNAKRGNPYSGNPQLVSSAFDDVFKIYEKHYNNADSDYERFLKEIQDLYRKSRDNNYSSTIHYIFGLFFEQVFQLFIDFQNKRHKIYEITKEFYKDMMDLLDDKEALWVLSLNHDLIIEFLCFDYNVPLSFGGTDTISFPISNLNFEEIINFTQIPQCDLDIHNAEFIKGEKGINLIKLHGALNEFAYDDKSKLIHVKPAKNESSSSYLEQVNTVLTKMKHYVKGQYMPVIGELAVSDMQGVCQFFKKSILTGGYKYGKTFEQKAGEEKMNLLKQVLLQTEELIIMGYGFNDEHINNRIDEAMILNQKLKLIIADPFLNSLPAIIERHNHNNRITKAQFKTPEWLHYMKTNEHNFLEQKKLDTIRNVMNILSNNF